MDSMKAALSLWRGKHRTLQLTDKAINKILITNREFRLSRLDKILTRVTTQDSSTAIKDQIKKIFITQLSHKKSLPSEGKLKFIINTK
jgi:DNA transposition AAA+ family ATPase